MARRNRHNNELNLAALEALERLEKTINALLSVKPQVFGLPPIDIETIRAALQATRTTEPPGEKE